MISEAPNVHRLLRHVCEGDAKGKYVERGNRDHICKQSISYGMYCNILDTLTMGSSTTELWLHTIEG